MKNFTASKLELAKACPGSFGLPWRDDPSQWSDAGKGNHAELERRIIEGDIPESLTTTYPNVTQWFAETQLAYNIATGEGRVIGHGSGRDYSSCGPTEMGGTCDVYGVDGDRIIVVDWKLKNFTKASDNLQLRWYAIALARALGKDCATIAIFPEVGKPSTSDLEPWDFDAFAAELQELTLVVNKAIQLREPLEVGPQCRNCPAFLSCPKQKKEFALVVSGATDVQVEMALPLNSDEQASYAFDVLQQLELMAKRLRGAIYARAGAQPIPLSNGMVLGQREKLGNREIDPDKAYHLIRSRYGQVAADKAVRREVAQTWIVDALKDAGVKTAGATKDALIEELDKAGAVTRKRSTVIEQYQPQQALKAANQ